MSTASSPLLQHALVGPSALRDQAPRIQELFATLFGRSFPASLWSHYFEPDFGLPAAGVGLFDRDALVGFGACLPLELEGEAEGETLDLGLVTTVMISPEHRHGGQTYVELMLRIREVAESLGHRGLLAFPNDLTFLPITRLAGFAPVDEARWVSGPVDHPALAAFLEAQSERSFLTERALRWRLGRFDYRIENGRILKPWQGEEDCLDLLPGARPDSWSGRIPWWLSAGAPAFPLEAAPRIRLCWLSLGDDRLIDRVRRSLLYSDVY